MKRATCWVGFLIGLAVCVVAAAGVGQVSGAEADPRPNLVFVLIDDQRFDAMSCMGHPFLKTPNMDRLAREGATFANAFVTTSLCSPSRASFLTGCYAHKHGVWANVGRDPHENLPTYPEVLQSSGYTTAFIGKWHMAAHNRPRAGFDHWVSFTGQGRYRGNRLNVDGREVEAKKYVTDALTDYAVDFLRRRTEQPWLMILSHKAVHAPFTPATRHAELFADVEIRSQHREADRLEDKVDWGRRMPDDWQRLIKDTDRALVAVDESLGRVLDTLDELKMADRTVVVFTSDNGYFHGEHGGMWDKRAAYEPAMRIPLLMRYPPLVRPGSKVDGMVLNVDLAPTLLELAGVPIPQSVQGRSWLPLLRGEEGRDAFLYEYFREGDKTFNRPSVLAVRTRRLKYIVYPGAPDAPVELYDLQKDPHELNNLIGSPDYRQTAREMAGKMRELQKATGFRFPDSRRQ